MVNHFKYNKNVFIIIRNSKTSCFILNNIHKDMTHIEVCDWSHIEFSTRCYYKNKDKIQHYIKFTNNMNCLLLQS